MKTINIKYFFGVALLSLVVMGCKDSEFEDGKIQSVDNHGKVQKIISTAVSATANNEFAVIAVDPTTDEAEYGLIPVVLNSKDPAPEDIHITMVPAPDSLDSYNNANDAAYDLAGTDGTPAFTLMDDGVVTIPKGSFVGYLKIKAVSFDYYGSNAAFPYRIESVKEPGYIISGNHNFGIAVLIAKNQYDGKYDLNITTSGWAAYGISDNLPGDYGTIEFWTTGASSNTIFVPGSGLYEPAFTADNASKTVFGATEPIFTFDSNNKLIDVHNGAPDDGRGRNFYLNTDAPETSNLYDPDTKTIYADYYMIQNGRPDQHIVAIMTYKGPR